MYAELATCMGGIYACFLVWGVTQERVTATTYDGNELHEGGKFRYYVFLNLAQALTASIVAILYLKLRRLPLTLPSKETLRSYLQLAAISTVAPNFGYASLKHIDYPTMILGKSCKLIPVMIMNFVLYRRTFPAQKYFIVALITVGVSAFMLLHKQEADGGHGKPKGKSANSAYGLGLLFINLLMDGGINSVQDQMFKKHRVSGSSMMLFMNLFSSALMVGYLILNPYTTELADALSFCTAHPGVIGHIMLFALCGAVGQCFIFHTLEKFGAVSLVTVTVTRKMISILLSIFWFDHRLSAGQWAAVFVVFFGIGMEAWLKKVQDDRKEAGKGKGNGKIEAHLGGDRIGGEKGRAGNGRAGKKHQS